MRRCFQWLMIAVVGWAISACNLNLAPSTTDASWTPNANERLILAWVDAGNLIVWQTGDTLARRVASGGVIQPMIAPDGNHIAFTRGPAGIAESLWVVDVAGEAERQIAGGAETPAFRTGTNLIGDVQWLDSNVLYFNTSERQALAPVPRDDLYRVHINTRDVALILPSGEGGAFHISPDKQWIAVVSAGTYGRQDGAIRVVDLLAQQPPRRLLFYIGVASGEHSPFYPYLQWTPDSDAILTAIPNADLLYADTEDSDALPPTSLWRLPIDTPSDRDLIGTVQASFFGLPRWSDDTSVMTYLQRETNTNSFQLMTANTANTSSQPYLIGEAGRLGSPQWVTASNDFIYTLDETVYLARYEGGVSWQLGDVLSQEIVFAPQTVSPTTYVFITSAAVASDGYQFRIAQFGQASDFVTQAGTTIPVYNALYLQSR